jgi:GNAT superfamily N-acetyltransferase
LAVEIHDSVTAEFNKFVSAQAFSGRKRSERKEPLQHLWLSVRGSDTELVAACRILLRNDWVTIEAIWVDAAGRRKGVGTSLLKAAEDLAQSRGFRGVEATIYGFEAPAFFLSAGFQTVGQLESTTPSLSKTWVVKSFAPLKLAFPRLSAQGSRSAARAAVD